MTFNFQIPQINLHADSEQISDVLDFLKFQNYTTVYGREIINYPISYYLFSKIDVANIVLCYYKNHLALNH